MASAPIQCSVLAPQPHVADVLRNMIFFPAVFLLELVRARETFWRQPAGIGAIAAPVGKLLERGRKRAPCPIRPGQAVLAREGLDVRQPAILEALNPHAGA